MQTAITSNSVEAIEQVLDYYQGLLDLGLEPGEAKETLFDALTVPIGGYQDAAHLLHALTGRTYSRQAAQGLYTRRNDNGFPGKQQYHLIGSRIVEAFSLKEVEAWQRERAAGKDRKWR